MSTPHHTHHQKCASHLARVSRHARLSTRVQDCIVQLTQTVRAISNIPISDQIGVHYRRVNDIPHTHNLRVLYRPPRQSSAHLHARLAHRSTRLVATNPIPQTPNSRAMRREPLTDPSRPPIAAPRPAWPDAANPDRARDGGPRCNSRLGSLSAPGTHLHRIGLLRLLNEPMPIRLAPKQSICCDKGICAALPAVL